MFYVAIINLIVAVLNVIIAIISIIAGIQASKRKYKYKIDPVYECKRDIDVLTNLSSVSEEDL